MHKVYENNDLMMYFKKRHCHCCGTTLQTKTTERIVRKGDPDHSAYCSVGTSYKPHGDILVVGKEYYCPSCNKTFSCEEQGDVINAQKYCRKTILSQAEIDNAKENKIAVETDAILKMRWLLMIPVVGGLLCTIKIFSGKLREKTKKTDLHKLFLAAIILFVIVALVIKLVLSAVNNDFVNDYDKLIMLIPALCTFNIPFLWYINHTFKK